MWTFSCVFTFTALLACVSVLDLEYSHFLLEYPPIRAWPISKWNLNWSYLFMEVRHVEFSLYSKNEFTTATSIRKKNRYFNAFLEFLPTLYLLWYWSNESMKLYNLFYWWATSGWGILCLDEPILLTQCAVTVGCDNVETNFTGNFPVSFQAVAVRNLLFLSWNVLCSPCCIFGGLWNKDGKFFLFTSTVPAASMPCLFKWIRRGRLVYKLSKNTWWFSPIIVWSIDPQYQRPFGETSVSLLPRYISNCCKWPLSLHLTQIFIPNFAGFKGMYILLTPSVHGDLHAGSQQMQGP